MSDFVAKIKAILDTSQVEKQLKDLEDKKIHIDLEADTAQQSVKQLDQEIRSADNTTRSFTNTLRGTVVAAKTFDVIRDSARKAVTAVKDFDSAIKDLRMATGDSYESVSQLVKGYNALGKSLGAVTTEVTDSANSWLRQGNTIAETNTLIRDSMILSKVASIDSAEAAKFLTSATKGYGVEAKNVIGIVDKLTAVDLVSATDAGGLAEAMSRTAQTAKLAGVEMDKLLGYLAVTGEVTQKSMTTIGESFKTIFTRMADIKEGKLEFIDEDGTVEILSNVELVLSNLGIKLRDSNNEFRNFGTVIDEVAARWDSFSTLQQAAISKAFAGTRQSENFKVLMENYDDAIRYMNIAADSAGTAEKKFGAYLDSIEAKTKSLQAAFESLAFNTISTSTVSGIIEATTAVVNLLDKTNILRGAMAGGLVAGGVKAFTLLRTAITSAALSMSNLNTAMQILRAGNVGQEAMQRLVAVTNNLSTAQLRAVLSSAALSTEQRIAILTAKGMSQAEAQATLASMGLATAQGTAAASTVTFSGALKGLWATLKANPLILVVTAITAAVSVYSSLKQKADEARRAALEAGNAAKEESKQLRDVYNAYAKAKTAYDMNVGSKESLSNATNELLATLGVERSEVEALAEEYGSLSEAINQVTIDSLMNNLAKVTAGYSAAKDELLSAANDHAFYEQDFGELVFSTKGADKVFADYLSDAGFWSRSNYNTMADIYTSVYAPGADSSSIEGIIAIYDKLIEMRDKLNEGVTDGTFTREELASSSLYKEIISDIEMVETEYGELIDYINEINRLSANIDFLKLTKNSKIPETQAEFDALKQSMIDTAIASGRYVGSQKQIEDAIIGVLATMPELSKFFQDYTEQADTPEGSKYVSFPKLIFDSESENDYIDQLNAYRKQMEYLQETLSSVRDGSITPEDKIDLFTAYPELANVDDLDAGIVSVINSLKGASADANKEATGIMAIFDAMYAQIDPSSAADIESFNALKSLYLSLFDTAEQGVPVFENLSDAISGITNASDLISDMQQEMAESGQISLGTLEKLSKEFGSNIGEYITFDDGKIIPKIDEIKKYYIAAIREMELEDPDLESTLISALDTGFSSYKMYLDAFNSAMSEVESAYDVLGKAQEEMKTGGLSNDTIRSISESLGDGESLSDYLIEENGVLSLNIEKWNERTQAIANAEIDAIKARMAELQKYISGYSDYTDNEVAYYEGDEEFERLQQARAEYEGLNGLLGVYNVAMANAANTTEEETTALERMSSALDNVSSVSDYLTFLESDDVSFIEALEKAVKLLEVMGEGYSLKDFFSFDDKGELIYNTQFLTGWIDTYINGMVTAGDVSQEFADRMKAAAQAEAEQVDSIEKLTDAMSKVEKASDLVAKAQEEIEKSGSNSIKTLISLYEQFGEKANDMYSISADGGFIIDTDLVKQEMYALIDEIEAASPEIKQAMKDALDVQLEEEAFEDTVDEYVNKIQTLQDALETLRSDGKLSDSALYDLVKEFPELATETDNLEAAITNLIGSMNTDIVAEFEKQFGKIDSEEDREQLQAFMDIVLKLGEVVGNTQFAIDINAEVDGMQNLFTAMKESVSSTGLTAESIANLKKRYQDLESYDPARLFERTENGIHLNTKALRELESEYEKLTKESIDNTLDDLVDQYNELTRQIDAAGTSASTVELYAQRNDILKQIEETAELAAQYAGLTSAFYAWEQAQSLGEEGDMYDSLTGGLKDIKQLYQDGLIGTNKFRTAVQLMSNEDLSNATAAELLAAYEAGYPKMQRYFQDSSDGVLHFLHDVEDLNSEWVHMNKDGSWDINFGVGNDQEIADALGINVESVQAILRKLSDYGFDINLDSMYSDLETMQSKAEKAAAKLKELGATDVDFDFDVTNLARLDEQIEDAEEALKKFTNADGTINLEMEGAAEAQYVLATLILQRQALEDPLIFKVDANNIEGVVGETLRKLQTIKQQYNNLQLQASIGADTSSIQSEIDTTLSSFTAEEIEILGKLGIDPTASSETINAAIAGITPEMLVAIGVDESAVTAFAEADHDTTATVVYNVDGSKVNSYTPRTKYASVKYTASMYDWTPPTKYGTVYYTAKTTPAKNNNFTPVAMARGTAYAGGTSGNWGAKNSGTALGGELGEELVVRDGKYFTIGSDGAEFFKYKKGDIIFNHKQTEELFKNGKLSGADGRGKAFAEGTAFSSGSGTITGGGSVVTTPSGGGSGSGSSSGDGEEEKESKIIDWIEIAIDRIERAIGKLGRIAQSAYKSLATRLRASDDEIKKVIEEINKQNQGYNRYMQQAESVNLSADLKEKVRNGTIDITEYDGDTAELIEEYQKWYEKALDCADAIDELHETLASLYEEKFNNIAADFDNQLTLIEHRAEMFNSSLDEIEARGYLGGSELYNELIATENAKVNKLNAKLAELTKAMSDAVNSGEVEVGSEAWYAMQAAINETKLAIQESEVAMLEYNNAIRDMEWQHFDYLQERISQITKEADFLINLMSDTDLYTDQGQLSDTGMATMGLHGMNYNTYLAQAEQYADEIKKLDEELAKDPYNKDLIARREELLALQQDSITSAEAEKQAIIDMVQEGINLELSSLKELIDAYTDSLDSAKDLYDYQKKIKKQTAEVASLQKQLAAYQNDTSEENRARLQKLEVDLSDAMEDLEETQYDRYIKEQKRLLDDFYDDYEENLNQRLDDVDALISDMIDMVNANSDDIADTIVSECADVGYTMSSSMNSIWLSGGAANNVITTYGNAFSDQLTTLNSVISGIATNVAAMVAAGDDAAEDETRGVTTTTDTLPTDPPRSDVTSPTTPPPITNPPTQTNPTPPTDSIEQTKKKQVKITSGTWHIRTGASTKYDIVGYAHKGDVFDFIESSGNWNAVTYNGKKRWINNGGSKIIEGYSKGGYIAELQKIAMQNGDDMFTVNTLKKGEAVLSPEQTAIFRQFADNHLTVLPDVLDTSKLMSQVIGKPISTGDSEHYGAKYEVENNITVEIDHVDNYDDLVYRMQKDHKFEKMIQAMTVDQLVGGSKLAKHKIRV